MDMSIEIYKYICPLYLYANIINKRNILWLVAHFIPWRETTVVSLNVNNNRQSASTDRHRCSISPSRVLCGSLTSCSCVSLWIQL